MLKNNIRLLLALNALVILFHACILIQLIPFTITWGGRLESSEEMYRFETMSIVVNLFFAWVLLMKGKYVSFSFSERKTTIILWIYVGVFILGTIGNFFAKSYFEKGFSVITGIFAFVLWKTLNIHHKSLLFRKKSNNISKHKKEPQNN